MSKYSLNPKVYERIISFSDIYGYKPEEKKSLKI